MTHTKTDIIDVYCEYVCGSEKNRSSFLSEFARGRYKEFDDIYTTKSKRGKQFFFTCITMTLNNSRDIALVDIARTKSYVCRRDATVHSKPSHSSLLFSFGYFTHDNYISFFLSLSSDRFYIILAIRAYIYFHTFMKKSCYELKKMLEFRDK